MLKIHLLGTPQLYLNGVSLATTVTGRELALLAYLAVTGNVQDRSTLFDLLWNAIGEQQARKNLRNLLYSLRQSIGNHLDSSRQTVGLRGDQPYWLDIAIFRNYWATPQNDTSHERLPEALRLYQGEFLQGFAIQAAPVFEAWLLTQRRVLQDQAIHGFQRLAQSYLAAGDYAAGLDATRRLLTIAPWHESGHRQQMLLLARSGQRSAALAQYQLCQQVLAEEYGVAPMTETTALYLQIKTGELAGTAQLVSAAAEPPPFPRQAPPAATQSNRVPSLGAPQVNWDAIPTVTRVDGRETELSQLEGWVLTAHCRVVAVVGLGGQGKTALLAEFVHRLAETGICSGKMPSVAETGICSGKRPSVKAELSLLPEGQAGEQAATFTHMLWASVMDGSSLAQILHTWLLQLAPAGESPTPAYPQPIPPLDLLLARFIHALRSARCLLILDQAEALWGHGAGKAAEQEALLQLLRWVAENTHQSCLLLSSRAQPQAFVRLARQSSAVRTLRLAGLAPAAGSALLRQRGLDQPSLDLALLTTRYGGHPLALTLLTELVQEFPTHTIELILQHDPLLLDELQTLLGGQLQQLPALAREMLLWLALAQEPVPFESLWDYFLATHSAGAVLAAYQTLQQALLIEPSPDRQTIGLPALFQHYALQHLIEQIVAELQQWLPAPRAFPATETDGTEAQLWAMGATTHDPWRRPPLPQAARGLAPTYLNSFRLCNPYRPESVQRAQTQAILDPIRKQLVATWGAADLMRHLYDLLATINTYAVPVGRYAKSNLHDLLALLETESHTPNEQRAACLPDQQTIDRRSTDGSSKTEDGSPPANRRLMDVRLLYWP
ncbi:MAG: BTAD domain-containing putative transcriptional regulator [Caldilineaceae bacterium]